MTCTFTWLYFGLVIMTGMFLAWVSTFFAVRKYLKMKEDDLYY